MLKRLLIKNFTLIDKLDIELHEGFSVITGETGAGKSIILGAIALLLGQRADTKSIKQEADKCIIEAHFDLSRYDMQDFFDRNDIEYDKDDTIVRRELTQAGKSRSFINDTPVPLATLKELGERLVDVHSQHQNLLLNKQDFQLSVVDIIADDGKLLKKYQEIHARYLLAKQRLEAVTKEIEQNRQNADFLQFQFNELSGAKLISGEQEELESKCDTMTHSEDIKTALYEAENALQGEYNGILSQLKNSTSALHGIEQVYPEIKEVADRMDSCYIELKDIDSEVSSRLGNIDFDPAELDAVNARLDRIYDLQKKYHATSIDELLALQEDLEQKLNNMENSGEALDELRKTMDAAHAECCTIADSLTKVRLTAARNIERQMRERLITLGMPNVRFEIQVVKEELGRQGQDRVSFLFSANTSTPLQPVSQVASGGEIARVMLSLKALISSAVKLPTIIFDEIDTGVSGKMAEQMAQIMYEMGMNERQVISITHLPQIAALGTTHYKVFKEETANGTTSKMVILNQEQRVSEIAQMLSGSDISEAAIANARQLLHMN
jgi:DNA repair protein RecN (Recombination protein N)